MTTETEGDIELTMGERSWGAAIIARDLIVSRHTGRELEALEVTFPAGGDEDELIADLASEARQGRLSSAGERSKQWSLEQSSYSYRHERGPRWHTWHLRELETLAASSVVIDGIELRPERYHERMSGERLVIDLRAKVSTDDLERLQELWLEADTVSVTRVGVSEERKTMELGWGPWSEHEDGSAKIELKLSDPEDQDRRGLLEPLLWNLLMAAGRTNVAQKGLLDLLVSKGVITQDEARALTETSRREAMRSSMRFWLVVDLDKWPWGHEHENAQ